jgi:hypothetical protein
MRWLCFLLAPNALAQVPRPPVKPLRYDLAALPVTRDSFVFRVRGEVRGWAVWQYEVKSVETGQQVVFTVESVLQPTDTEHLRVVADRLTGAPVSLFLHVESFTPQSDTVMIEHDLDVKDGRVEGRRRAAGRKTGITIAPIHVQLPAGVAWSNYQWFAAPGLAVSAGDTLVGRGYTEFGDSIETYQVVAEALRTITVPAGQFAVLPIVTDGLRLYVNRAAPRRVVKGETLDGAFTFELVHSGPPVTLRTER